MALQDGNTPRAAPDTGLAAPASLTALYHVLDRIGEGTYGVVFLAKSLGPFPRLLAIKTFKPGKVRLKLPIPSLSDQLLWHHAVRGYQHPTWASKAEVNVMCRREMVYRPRPSERSCYCAKSSMRTLSACMMSTSIDRYFILLCMQTAPTHAVPHRQDIQHAPDVAIEVDM